MHSFISTAFKHIRLYLSKGITLGDAVFDPIHIQVHTKVEIFPMVMLSTFILGQLVAFDPLSLWYPRVLYCGLDDANAVIL